MPRLASHATDSTADLLAYIFLGLLAAMALAEGEIALLDVALVPALLVWRTPGIEDVPWILAMCVFQTLAGLFHAHLFDGVVNLAGASVAIALAGPAVNAVLFRWRETTHG